MKTIKEQYQHDLDNGFIYDAKQAQVVEALDQLSLRLIRRLDIHHKKKRNPLNRFAKIKPATGLYIWGDVGRGKTYLMDLFYDSIPFRRKMRLHFHRFMAHVQQQLREKEGQTNPLDLVADDIAEEAKIICFDEFFVSDIGDAIVLGGLMTKLFDRGVTLVTTSNIPPKRLYENGLQRHRFIPCIEALVAHTQEINLDSDMDYRLRVLEQANLYFTKEKSGAQDRFNAFFQELTAGEHHHGTDITIQINNRGIQAKERAADVIWFDFDELCKTARSVSDYIELAKSYSAIFISNVSQMNSESDEAARRFINMVDEFYDRQVKLVLLADVPMPELYTQGMLNFEFQRTQSRLTEMQSHEYLALPHLP